MDALTEKQKAYLDFIREFKKANKYAPAYKEIAKHFNTQVGIVQYFLNVLEKKGYITRMKGQYRTLQITKKKVELK